MNKFWTKLNFELVHQVHVCQDAKCPRLSLGNLIKPPAIPYNYDIAFLRPADLKGEVHFKMASFFVSPTKRSYKGRLLTKISASKELFNPMKSLSEVAWNSRFDCHRLRELLAAWWQVRDVQALNPSFPSLCSSGRSVECFNLIHESSRQTQVECTDVTYSSPGS